MARPVHPNKEIDAAVEIAFRRGWRIRMSSGHSWAIILCCHADRNGCRASVYSTPRSPANHAKQILKMVEGCGHEREVEERPSE